jgi:hypothetical protein
MKVRSAAAGTGLSARLTAVGCAILALLASAAISACTGGSSPPVGLPTSSASNSGSATASAPPSSVPPSTVPPSTVPPSTVPPSSPATLAPSSPATLAPSTPDTTSPSPAPFTTVAPPTGGGGTAGFQHGLLLFLGVLAILAGAGIVYRRRFLKNR